MFYPFAMSILKNLTVVVCTLNEEDNIKECLRCIKQCNPERIIVVDGDSSDRTQEIVEEEKDVDLFLSPRRGICFQRNYALSLVSTPYISFVDADDRIDEKCLATLMRETAENNLDAIMAITKSFENNTYWQKAMDFSLNDSKMIPGPTNMIGQPSLFKVSTIKELGYDPLLPTNEDTEISRKLEIQGAGMMIGSGINYRIHDKKFKDIRKKIFSYGRGDAYFVFKFPDRYKNMKHHLLINYPVKKSLHALKNSGLRYIPFFIMMGLGRYFTMKYFLVKLRKDYGEYSKYVEQFKCE